MGIPIHPLLKKLSQEKIMPGTVKNPIFFNQWMGVDGTIQIFKEKIRPRNTSPNARTRFWEIDFLRGIAIILMVGFHGTVDCYFLKGEQPGVNPLVLSLWQMTTAGLFLLLAGVSLTLHRSSPERTDQSACHLQQHRHLWRGLVILGWGLLITAITRLFLPKDYIIFGILHLIGMAMFISQPLLHLKFWNLWLGVMVIGLGIYLSRQRVPFPWLVWAGFIPQDFASVDYFPIFPWYGVVLIGIFIGKILYGDQGRNFFIKSQPRHKVIRWLCYLGRNSLMIYLVHQPILLLLVFLLGM